MLGCWHDFVFVQSVESFFGRFLLGNIPPQALPEGRKSGKIHSFHNHAYQTLHKMNTLSWNIFYLKETVLCERDENEGTLWFRQYPLTLIFIRRTESINCDDEITFERKGNPKFNCISICQKVFSSIVLNMGGHSISFVICRKFEVVWFELVGLSIVHFLCFCLDFLTCDFAMAL